MRLALLALTLAPLCAGAPHPKVRAITGFVQIDARNYAAQFEETARFLGTVRSAYKASGWDVQTIRIATQPFPQYTRGMSRAEALALLHKIDEISLRLGFTPAIGPAMLQDGDDTAPVDLLIDLFSKPSRLNASLITAGEDGIHWRAIREAGRLVKAVSERSPHSQSCFNFAAIAMLGPDGPFYPGAYHLGAGRAFAVGLQGASLVDSVFAEVHDPVEAEKRLAGLLTVHLKEAEAIAVKASAGSGWTYVGIDPTPAPMGDVSIGRAFESFTGGPFGAGGTMTAAAIVTRAVKSVPVKQTGYSGLMVPVLEDTVLARRWAEGSYNIDSLLAYSAVCAGGVDTVPLPGEVTSEQLSRIIGDVATLAYKWHKPLAARLLPVAGKHAGERTEFTGGTLANTVLQPLHR